jgi:FdhD protein
VGMTLLGFVRPPRANAYSREDRLVPPGPLDETGVGRCPTSVLT